jgi:ABC-2 type transport system ATP-binding protein
MMTGNPYKMVTSSSGMSDQTVAVSINRVSKTYPVPFLRLKKFLRRKFKPPVEALREVTFTVGEGEIFGLIGPNGAGKTTLTKIIATLVQPTSGQAIVKGYDSVRHDEDVRRQVGLAGAEERSFYWRLTAEQNLIFFARLYGLSDKAAKQRMAELFELFELNELAKRRFGELSTGNKQRLAVARAMLARPPVLLLDEPTRSLDPIAAAHMRTTIRSLARDNGQRVTVFFTSHNLNEVEELCDRVAIIGKGEIRALDTPRNLRALHSPSERVSVTVAGIRPIDADLALSRVFNSDFFSVEPGEHESVCVVRFTRETNDETLDKILRVFQQSGAAIRAVESERATLLDVLESYDEKSET